MVMNELDQIALEVFGTPESGNYSAGGAPGVKSLMLSDKVKAWSPIVERESLQYGVDPDFVLGVMQQESRGNPEAESNVGAYGLMQLMPETAKELGVNQYDPEQNISGGVKLLSDLLKKYNGDKKKALAAYNGGESGVNQAVSKYGDSWLEHLHEFKGINKNTGKNYAEETRDYIEKISGYVGLDSGPADFDKLAAAIYGIPYSEQKQQVKTEIPELANQEINFDRMNGTDLSIPEPAKFDPNSAKFQTESSDATAIQTDPLIGEKYHNLATLEGPHEAALMTGLNALTFTKSPVDPYRFQEHPIASTVGAVAGSIVPAFAGGAGVQKALLSIPKVAKLAQAGKWGYMAFQGVTRAATSAADFVTRNNEELLSSDPKVREKAVKNLGISIAASLVSPGPEVVLPKGWIQPLAQMATDAIVNTGLQAGVNKENAWSKDNIIQTVASIITSGLFSFNDIRKPTGSNPSINTESEVKPNVQQEMQGRQEGQVKTDLSVKDNSSVGLPISSKKSEPVVSSAQDVNIDIPMVLKLLRNNIKKQLPEPQKGLPEPQKRLTDNSIPDHIDENGLKMLWNDIESKRAELENIDSLYKLVSKELFGKLDRKSFSQASDKNFAFENNRFFSKDGKTLDQARYDFIAKNRDELARFGITEDQLQTPSDFAEFIRDIATESSLKTLKNEIKNKEDQYFKALETSPQKTDESIIDSDMEDFFRNIEKLSEETKQVKDRMPGEDDEFPLSKNDKFSEETGDLFAGTKFEDSRSETKKKIDAEIQRREMERKIKRKANIGEDTPLFDANVREANATKQENLFKVGESSGEYRSIRELRKDAYANKSGVLKPTDYENEYQQKWRTPSKMRVEGPEMAELYKAVSEGKYPKLMDKLRTPFTLGSARNKIIMLRRDVFIGPLKAAIASQGKQKDFEIASIKDELIKSGVNENDIVIKEDEGLTKIYVRDQDYAEQTFAHEIGHVISSIRHIGNDKQSLSPNELLKEKSLGGKLAGVAESIKDYLSSFPGAKGKPLDGGELQRLNDIAKKMTAKNVEEIINKEITSETDYTPDEIKTVWNSLDQSKIDPKLYDYIARLDTAQKKSIILEAIRGKAHSSLPKKTVTTSIEYEKILKKVFGTPEEIAKKYNDLIIKEVEKRRLIDLGVMKQELKRLSRIWKPFDPKENTAYTKYRHHPEELYADAVSAFLVHPELVAKEAPTFYKGFLNYMENRPELMDAWEKIQGRSDEEIKQNRSDRVREDYRKAEEIRKKQFEERLKEPTEVLSSLKKMFVDKYEPLNKRVKQVEKSGVKINPEDDPRLWLEEWHYVPGQIKGFLQDVDTKIRNVLIKNDLTVEDLGEYMDYKRQSTELIDKPGSHGIRDKYAEEQLDFIKNKLGAEKFNVLEKAAQDFWKIRNDHIIPLLKKSNMFADPLIDKIANNEFYAKHTIVDFMEENFGKVVSKDLIKSIKGTFRGKANPFVETVIQDAMLVRAIHRNNTNKSIARFLNDHFPSEIVQAGKDQQVANNKETELIHYVEVSSKSGNAEVKKFEIDKEIADLVNTDPTKINAAVNLWYKYVARPIKEILTQKNPWFIGRNVIRDVIALSRNVPEANIISAAKFVFSSYPEAWNAVRGRELTKTVREMYKDKALLSGRYWNSKEILNADDELDRVMTNYGLSESGKENFIKRNVSKFFGFIENVAETTEKATKIGGYKLLAEKAPKMTAKERAHLVRTMAGSPDFMRGGTARMIYNNLFLFSNANIQGWRGAIEGAKRNKSAFAVKTLLYDVLPKTVMFAAKAGALAYIMGELGKKLQDAYKDIPETQLARYTIVPLPFTSKSGNQWFFKIPSDFTGQTTGAMFWNFLNAAKDGATGKDVADDIMNIWKEAGAQFPFSTSSLHPIIETAQKWGTYLGGKNPIDEWNYKEIIPERVFGTGVENELPYMSKWTAEQFGLNVWWQIPNNVDLREKDTFEKIFDYQFVVGPGLKAFIGLTDSRKTIPEDEKIAKKENKIRLLDKNKAIQDHIKANAELIRSGKERDSVRALYYELTKAGTVNKRTVSFREFYKSYKEKAEKAGL